MNRVNRTIGTLAVVTGCAAIACLTPSCSDSTTPEGGVAGAAAGGKAATAGSGNSGAANGGSTAAAGAPAGGSGGSPATGLAGAAQGGSGANGGAVGSSGSAGSTSAAGTAGNAAGGAAGTAGTSSAGSAGTSGSSGDGNGGTSGDGSGGTAGSSGTAGTGGAGSTNLALNQPVTADSEETAKGNIVSHGNDGLLSTKWCANNADLNHFVHMDLGADHALTGVDIAWEFPAAIYKYKIEASTDDVAWTVVDDQTANTVVHSMDTFTATGRYLRVTVTGLATGNWACWLEINVFGS